MAFRWCSQACNSGYHADRNHLPSLGAPPHLLRPPPRPMAPTPRRGCAAAPTAPAGRSAEGPPGVGRAWRPRPRWQRLASRLAASAVAAAALRAAAWAWTPPALARRAVALGLGVGAALPQWRHGGARAENPRPYGYNPDAWKSRGRAVPPEAWRAIERLGANESSFTGTPSGLYFLDTKEGSGSRCCDEGVEVAVGWSIRRASGRLIDASRGFTSALTAGEELRFTPKRLILGIRGVGMRDDVVEAFREGVVGMREGGGRRLVVPPALGWYYPEQRPFPAEEARQQDLNVHRREPLLVDIVLRTVASAPAPPP
ncbi:unnamed protein product [Prorocentrum cordatum]|uniref:peptidylprolyl isomerase n=1 Tax=Prorocentrum cordatum TaxID=2364126 RepID=A0ABN9URP8_9DINO|nr:unnamed protein product [Polarella glacialis]